MHIGNIDTLEIPSTLIDTNTEASQGHNKCAKK